VIEGEKESRKEKYQLLGNTKDVNGQGREDKEGPQDGKGRLCTQKGPKEAQKASTTHSFNVRKEEQREEN